MAKKQKRPYSTSYTARSNPRRYLLDGIPPTFWEQVQRKARREQISVRALLLGMLDRWLHEDDPTGWVRRAQTLAREATWRHLPPELQKEVEAAGKARLAQRRQRDVADEDAQ